MKHHWTWAGWNTFHCWNRKFRHRNTALAPRKPPDWPRCRHRTGKYPSGCRHCCHHSRSHPPWQGWSKNPSPYHKHQCHDIDRRRNRPPDCLRNKSPADRCPSGYKHFHRRSLSHLSSEDRSKSPSLDYILQRHGIDRKRNIPPDCLRCRHLIDRCRSGCSHYCHCKRFRRRRFDRWNCNNRHWRYCRRRTVRPTR